MDNYEKQVTTTTFFMDGRRKLKGAHEAQVSEGGEADLHRHLADCTKNPGHRSFIPVDKFTLDHLPESQRDLDLCEFIKCIADLTVRVSVRMTSPGRPMFWPDSTLPYPCSIKNGGHLRTGSGQIRQVLKYEHTACRCDKCKQSETSSDVWWVIGIQTATHVVYDDVEAENSNIRLFYDRKNSPLFVLDNVQVWSINVERDLAVLKCVTCNEIIARKLETMMTRFKDLQKKVFDKFSGTREGRRLTFIVSHPHGCSKQISIGRWIDKRHVDEKDYLHKLSYTTATCPGSSGAAVYCVGYISYWWVYHHVHSGAVPLGPNYSAVGFVY